MLFIDYTVRIPLGAPHGSTPQKEHAGATLAAQLLVSGTRTGRDMPDLHAQGGPAPLISQPDPVHAYLVAQHISPSEPADLPPAAHGAGFQYLTLVRRSNRAAPEPAAADDDDGTGH